MRAARGRDSGGLCENTIEIVANPRLTALHNNVYAQAVKARVYHYRDNTGLEVDVIVDAGPRRWAAFEIKLGRGRIDDDAASLLQFANRADTTRIGEPAALAVVTASGYGYQRPDGVGVIPVGALGP